MNPPNSATEVAYEIVRNGGPGGPGGAAKWLRWGEPLLQIRNFLHTEDWGAFKADLHGLDGINQIPSKHIDWDWICVRLLVEWFEYLDMVDIENAWRDNEIEDEIAEEHRRLGPPKDAVEAALRALGHTDKDGKMMAQKIWGQ